MVTDLKKNKTGVFQEEENGLIVISMGSVSVEKTFVIYMLLRCTTRVRKVIGG